MGLKKEIIAGLDRLMFRRGIAFVKRNLPGVTAEIHENIVLQLWLAGVSWGNINKWLAWRRLRVIKYYCVIEPSKTVRYWVAEVPMADRAALRAQGKQIVFVG